MRKGLHVILLLLGYALASWSLRDLSWAPPPLVSPEQLAQLSAPWSRPVGGGGPEAGHLAAAELVQPTHTLRAPAGAGATAAATMDPGSWEGFLAKLRGLSEGQRDKVRVLQLGDSEIVADGTSAALRRAFAARFGLGGLGFSLPMLPLPWYQHEHWSHEEGTSSSVFAYPYGKLEGGRYGPGGVSFEATPGARARATLSHPVAGSCTVQFFYDHLPGGGKVRLFGDGFEMATVDTAGARPSVGVETMKRRRCPTELSFETREKATRLYGWSLEYDRPGVVWSSLGVVGAKIAQLSHYDRDHLIDSLAALRPDLLVMTFGLNLAAQRWPPPPSYRTEVAEVLRLLRRGLPGAACLVVGPYPVGYPHDDGLFQPEAESAQVIGDYQRQAAESAGCTFLDRFRLAGGAAAARRWMATRPKILTGDYQHLTVEGSDRMGAAIAEVLLGSYDGVDIDGAAAFALERRRGDR